MKKLEESVEKEIIKWYHTGISTKEISEKVGCYTTTINAIFRRNNLKPISRKKLSEEQSKEIAKRYEAGETSPQLAKEFDVSNALIVNAINVYGSGIRDKRYNIDVNKLNELIQQGNSLTKLEKVFNCSRNVLAKRLKEEGITIVNEQNRTKFDCNIFDSIDTEEKAYWLGFIFADGYISSHKEDKKKTYHFELSLALKDVDHLEKFNKFIKNEQIIKTDSYRCRCSLTNKHLWETLNSYGCTPQKSLTLKFPDKSIFKNESLIRHFLRGYCDGDGSLGIIKKTGTLNMDVLGTKEFLIEYLKYLEPRNLILSSKTSTNTWYFEFSGAKALLYAYLLYHNSTIYLERKYQKILQTTSCRSKEKFFELLEGKIGEGWDADPELIQKIKDSGQCNA